VCVCVYVCARVFGEDSIDTTRPPQGRSEHVIRRKKTHTQTTAKVLSGNGY
jgi:hypothetical protein